jgi:hypothetical protein
MRPERTGMRDGRAQADRRAPGAASTQLSNPWRTASRTAAGSSLPWPLAPRPPLAP